MASYIRPGPSALLDVELGRHVTYQGISKHYKRGREGETKSSLVAFRVWAPISSGGPRVPCLLQSFTVDYLGRTLEW